jgi:DNA-binding IclR family transcriptional regulator
VAYEAKHDAIYATVEDDDEAIRQTDLLTPEFEEIRARIYALDTPTTREGRWAFAGARSPAHRGIFAATSYSTQEAACRPILRSALPTPSQGRHGHERGQTQGGSANRRSRRYRV